MAFEYDPKQRGRTITGQSIFAELQNVLNKKTVTVFSLYTYEFYYYEVNDYTLLSTLKDWIIRDTKIPRCDLMLFTKNKNFDLTSDDEKIALNTVCEVRTMPTILYWCAFYLYTNKGFYLVGIS